MGQQASPPPSTPVVATTPPEAAPPAAPAAPTNGAAGAATDPFAGLQTQGRTVEDVEAEYRARLGGHQRGWNAAETALRSEIETLKGQINQQALGAPAASGQGGQQVPDAAQQQQIATLRQQVETAEKARTIAERRAKFPSLSTEFVDDSVFAALDEADLAKLAAKLETNVSGGFIAPTAPRRAAAAPATEKPIHERSKDELLADLARLAPVVAEQERQRMGGR